MIIVDDGSTDDTVKLIAEFQDDSRVKYLSQKNKGPAAARNLGVENALGETTVYLDSDDEPFPMFLSTIHKILSNNPHKKYGVCNHNRSLELLDDKFKTRALKIGSATQNQCVTLQSFYNWEIKTTSTGLFHNRKYFLNKASWTSGIYIEDLEFLMQLAVLSEDGFIHVSQTLFSYRQKYGGDGLCSQASYQTYAEIFAKIYEIHRNEPLMKKPETYIDRVAKYKDLHEKQMLGKIRPQVYKYFPEFWEE